MFSYGISSRLGGRAATLITQSDLSVQLYFIVERRCLLCPCGCRVVSHPPQLSAFIKKDPVIVCQSSTHRASPPPSDFTS